MTYKVFYVNDLRECCYVVDCGSQKCVVIDPGMQNAGECGRIADYIRSKELEPEAILLTHAHFDHIYGVKECIERYGVKVYMSPLDKVVKDDAESLARDFGMPAPDIDWDTVDIFDGQRLSFGELEFEVIGTPGHSPGSVCFYDRQNGDLFSGDTLFAGTIGNTAHRWGDYDKEIVSIMDKLMGLDSDVKVHPGHGCGTTIGYERTSNPFLQPFNYKDPETGDVDGIEFR